MRLLVACIAAGGLLVGSAVAHADPGLYECPDTHAHVWHSDQCNDIHGPFGIPGTGGGGDRCGLICGVGKLLGGLGGLL